MRQIEAPPTLDNISHEWRMAFREAMLRKNITRIRKLGEEARESNANLSDWLIGRAELYDLDGLKKWSDLQS